MRGRIVLFVLATVAVVAVAVHVQRKREKEVARALLQLQLDEQKRLSNIRHDEQRRRAEADIVAHSPKYFAVTGFRGAEERDFVVRDLLAEKGITWLDQGCTPEPGYEAYNEVIVQHFDLADAINR